MKEIVLKDKEPAEEDNYLRIDWQELSEMGPQFDLNIDSFDYNINQEYWMNRVCQWTSEEVDRLTGWIDSQKSQSDIIMEECPDVQLEQLNPMQRLAFEIVKSHDSNKKQLSMIVLGDAGSGKTFTIHAISTYLEGKLRRAAPTAKAAFLINGDTVHQLFSIRVDKSRLYQALEGEALRRLQQSFLNVSYVIIDEYSMLSQTMLARIDKRMRQITQKFEIFFGGLSLILTGDPGQLPAVCAPNLYDQKFTTALSKEGFTAYQQFDSVIQLTQVIRQENDGNEDQRKFIDLLPRLRNSEATFNDYEHLKKRFMSPTNTDEFIDTTRIFALNDTCDDHNKACLQALKVIRLFESITQIAIISSGQT